MRFLAHGWHGGPLDSRHRIFVGRCVHFVPDLSGLAAEEVAQQVTVRWWTASGLNASTEYFEPDIPALVTDYLATEPPHGPIELTLDAR